MKCLFYATYMLEYVTCFRNPSIVLKLRLSMRFELTFVHGLYGIFQWLPVRLNLACARFRSTQNEHILNFVVRKF